MNLIIHSFLVVIDRILNGFLAIFKYVACGDGILQDPDYELVVFRGRSNTCNTIGKVAQGRVIKSNGLGH